MSTSRTADWFRRFAQYEAAGSSPSYERLAHAIADDSTTLDRLDELPPPRRQPNLLFAACTFLGADMGDTEHVMRFVDDRWLDIRAILTQRTTQTNEAARTAVFAPALAALPQPIALIELGASAGLCLYPDRYHVAYDDDLRAGPSDSPVHIELVTNGRVPRHADSPLEVVWRAGIDLSPLDAADPDDLGWLEACIWPEHTDRLERLRRAAEIAAADPPHLVHGDLIESLPDVIDLAPDDTTVVVFHSAVLNYLVPERRAEAAELIRSTGAVWLSNEGVGIVPGVEQPKIEPLAPGAPFVLAEGGTNVLALSDPHGRWLAWRPAEA